MSSCVKIDGLRFDRTRYQWIRPLVVGIDELPAVTNMAALRGKPHITSR